jgi:hypothetical protein
LIPIMPATRRLSGRVGALLLAVAAQAPAQEAAETPVAMIVGAAGLPAQCLAPVHVLEVDGEEVLTSAHGFELEPGWHRLNGRAELALDYCRPSGLAKGPAVPDLEAEFKAGVTYHVGLDHRSPDIRDWRLVIWKLESEAGMNMMPGEGAVEPFTSLEARSGGLP